MAETRASDNPIVCRLCLSDRKDSLKFIFDETLGPNRVPQKIQQLLSIQVQRNDKLSTMVCNDCIIRLDTFYSYKRQCHRNQARLGEWLAKTLGQSVHDTSFHIKTEVPDLESNEVHFMNGSGILPFKVEVNYSDVMEDDFGSFPISSTAYSVPDPNDHVYLENLPQEDERCPECGKRFQNVQNMRRHFNMTHRKEKRAQMAEIKKPDPKSNSENKNQKESNHSQHEKHSQLPDAQDKDKSQSESQCALKSKSNDKDTSPSEPNQSQCELQSLSTEVKDQNSTLPESNHSQCEIQLQSSEAKDRDTSNSESGISVCTPVSDDNTPADKTTEDLSSDVHMEDVSNTTVDNTTDKTLISDSQNTTSNDGSANNPDENPKEDTNMSEIHRDNETDRSKSSIKETEESVTKGNCTQETYEKYGKMQELTVALQKLDPVTEFSLLQKEPSPIELEELSKIELSYIEKCKAMVSMFHTLQCACHNAQHKNLRNLLSHLREMRVWFPLFTCYSCMISFTDRSTFTRHHKFKCNKSQLETLIKLANLKKRTETKLRLYQNYKCNRCNFLYTFFDEFCKHIDEEHTTGTAPFYCSCRLVFDTVEDYKNHCYKSCIISYYCDICFITTNTNEDFLKHCQESHDSSEGFVLLQEDEYVPRSTMFHHKEASDETNVVEGKRDRKKSFKQPIMVQIYDNELPPEPVDIPSTIIAKKILNLDDQSVIDWNAPASCPVCKKDYASIRSMVRHYRSHIERKEVTITDKDLGEGEDEDSVLYSCPECGGMYSVSNWINHLEEKHPLKSCSECDKMFNFQSELDQHRSVHLNIKVYRDTNTDSYKLETSSSSAETKDLLNAVLVMCEICDAMFNSKEDLKSHKLTCHGIKASSNPEEDSMENDSESNKVEAKYGLENLQTMQKIDDLSGHPCETCGKVYASTKTLNDHMKNMHGTVYASKSEYPKKCEHCDRICLTGSGYYLHKQMHERMTLTDIKKDKGTEKINLQEKTQDEEASYHMCYKCFKVFATKTKLRDHMWTHGINPSKPGPKPGFKKNRKVLCNLCHVAVDNRDALIKHKIEEHIDELEDEDMPGSSEPDVEDKINTSSVTYTCDICDETFTSRSGLIHHKRTHLVVPKIKSNAVYCKYCKTAFNSINDLTKHMHLEHGESAKPKVKDIKEALLSDRIFKCPICTKAFASMGALTAHTGWHRRSGQKVLINNESGNTTPEPAATVTSTLKTDTENVAEEEEQLISTNMSEFYCTLCSVNFPNDTALQIHNMEKHGSVDEFMLVPRCEVCNQDFDTQDEYEKHQRLHVLLERKKRREEQVLQTPIIQSVESLKVEPPQSSPKLVSCNYCSAMFNKADSLNTHINQYHKEHVESEFYCGECDAVFDKQSSLNNHLKVHEMQHNISAVTSPSGAKKYSCSICNLNFSFPKDLRKHTITAHPF